MSKTINMIKKGRTFVASAVTTALVSGGAFAADYTTEIATASTEGSANVTAVILAVIGIAILGFGVNALTGWFKK
ncbi:hypothetical protein ACM9HF_11555 [Colwellia sp. RE-S-Sl-9]